MVGVFSVELSSERVEDTERLLVLAGVRKVDIGGALDWFESVR